MGARTNNVEEGGNRSYSFPFTIALIEHSGEFAQQLGRAFKQRRLISEGVKQADIMPSSQERFLVSIGEPRFQCAKRRLGKDRRDVLKNDTAKLSEAQNIRQHPARTEPAPHN